MNQMMKCGCAAQGTCNQLDGVKLDPPVPVCIVHECVEPAKAEPDLTGRTATCGLGCHNERPSSPSLPFFEHLPERATDRYYCGCRGWD